MSVFSSKQQKGAARAHRVEKRRQAEERNALTPPERRRAARRDPAVGLLTEIFAEPVKVPVP